MFINYAHRGASHYAPENTMSSFRLGVEMGANGIELDLQKTKDGKIVIFHDDTIDNKSNGTGKIADYTYDELLQMDFGSWKDAKYAGEKIVLFEDFAKEFFPMNLTFAIELKVIGIEKEVVEIIRKYQMYENIYISSFMYEALENMSKIDANAKLSWLIEEKISEENIAKLVAIHGCQICPEAESATAEDIKLAKEYGLEVRLWGVYNEEIMKHAYQLDTEGMTVNFPDKLRMLIEGKG